MTTPEARFLPELQESEAPDEIRAIYREIRHLTGVPMVALIWRHLATLPGVLPDVWSSLAPVLRSGLLQETAWQVALHARVPQLVPLGPADLARLGVDGEGRRAIGDVLAAYNRANPVNMLCVTTLLARLLRPDGQALAPDVVLWQPPASVGPLPRMVAPAEMEPALRRLLDGLVLPTDAVTDPDSAIPSLYRHLLAWPGYLDWMAGALRDTIADDRLRQATVTMRASLAREADILVVQVPPALALQAHPQAKIALNRFSSLIPQMIVVGRLLEGALPKALPIAGRP